MEKPLDLNYVMVKCVFGEILTNLLLCNHHETVGRNKNSKQININIIRIRKTIIPKVNTV